MKFSSVAFAAIVGTATAQTCTLEATKLCMSKLLVRPTTCAAGVTPKIGTDCCLDCRPACAEVSPCADGVRPTIDTSFCPSCSFVPLCTKDKLDACRLSFSTLPVCAKDVRPTINTDTCCANCKPALPTCSDASRTACAATIAAPNFPVCAATVDPTTVFDATTCCVTCKKPPRQDAATACTFDLFKTCTASAPICAAGQPQEREPGQCCATCQRAERKCADGPIGVALCLKNRPECAQDEEAVPIDGECCKSCRPARPVCTTACKDAEVCGKGNVCVAKKTISLKIKVNQAARKAAFNGATPDEIRDMLVELVNRYCENPDNATECSAAKERIAQSIRVRKATGTAETDVQSVDVDFAGSTSRRLLLAESTLVQNALNTEGASAGYTVVGGSEVSSATRFGPLGALFGAAALALSYLL